MSSNSNTTRSSDIKVKMNKGKTVTVVVPEDLPKELDYLFEKELINKQNKHIHIMDRFGPSRNTHYLSTKFHAKHEQQIPQNHSTYIPFVYGTSYKHDTEANVYGWMPKVVNRPALLKELNFINAPKQRCCLTVYGEKLESDRANARPAFNGLRFFLQ
ncbi:uncharacterized protein LOC119614395 [Lucilia sericata]|uniref:uncharacterized protein LOC119614395 n=1 Tax=Lucilia sericata TaxID=13632 RepID=UPI0018A872DE|nr:uncharacterized protein LOC119614395 [Lucilia sericata]